MRVAFVDEVSAIFGRLDEHVLMDIDVFRESGDLFVVSPTGVTRYSGASESSAHLNLPEDNGIATKISCVSETKCVVVLSTGQVVFLDGMEVLERRDFGARVTAVAACNGRFIFGSDTGSLFVYMIGGEVVELSVLEMPVKEIRCGRDSVQVLSADGCVMNVCIDWDSCLIRSVDKIREGVRAIDSFGSRSVCVLFDGSFVVNGSIEVKSRIVRYSAAMWFDEETLLLIDGSNSLYVWSYRCRSLRKCGLHGVVRPVMCRVTSDTIYVLCESGVAKLPVVFHSLGQAAPLLFTTNRVIEYRQERVRAVMVSYPTPKSMTSRVMRVSADEEGDFIYVQMSDGFWRIERATGEWEEFRLDIVPVSFTSTRSGLAVMNEDSLVLYEGRDQHAKFEITDGVSLACDETVVCVCCRSRVDIFVNSYGRHVFQTDGPPLTGKVCGHLKRCLVLMESCDLLLINWDNGTVQKILDAVSDVYIDSGFGMFFVRVGCAFKVGDMKNVTLSPLIETTDICLGVNSACSTLLFKADFASDVSMSYYFDMSIVGELDNPRNAASSLFPIRGSPVIGGILRQITVFALRQGKGKHCVAFLSFFPEHFHDCVAAGLRSVESPERRDVLAMLGSCHMVFNEAWKQDPRTAALLLPVVVEEDGPVVGFRDAISVLRVVHDSVEEIGSLVRFINPLLSPPIPSGAASVVCGGIQFSINDYNELRRRLDEAISHVLTDMLQNVKCELIIPFASGMQTPLASFLMKNRSIDKKCDFLYILEKLYESSMTKEDHKSLARIMTSSLWTNWAAALVWCSGLRIQFSEIMSANPEMRKRFLASRWGRD